MWRATSMYGAGIALLLAGLAPASAQDLSVQLMTVPEEQISAATLEQARAAFSDERARLGIRLQARQPDQTPGTMTTSASELAGRAIDAAMSHGLLLAPRGAPIVVGLNGQIGPDNSRQLVLYNLTAWVSKGRKLGIGDLEAFALLDDARMRAGGDAFMLEGVRYSAKVENGSLIFHRQ
ncbi:MAG TPA: hypothetical protein VFZ91_00445 [Allosphingosinicella sp.]